MGDDSFIGSLALFAGTRTFVPRGWAACDGQQINISQNQALYAIIGNRYGGDGVHNYNLPKLNEGKKPNEPFYVICTEGLFPSPQ